MSKWPHPRKMGIDWTFHRIMAPSFSSRLAPAERERVCGFQNASSLISDEACPSLKCFSSSSFSLSQGTSCFSPSLCLWACPLARLLDHSSTWSQLSWTAALVPGTLGEYNWCLVKDKLNHEIIFYRSAIPSPHEVSTISEISFRTGLRTSEIPSEGSEGWCSFNPTRSRLPHFFQKKIISLTLPQIPVIAMVMASRVT